MRKPQQPPHGIEVSTALITSIGSFQRIQRKLPLADPCPWVGPRLHRDDRARQQHVRRARRVASDNGRLASKATSLTTRAATRRTLPTVSSSDPLTAPSPSLMSMLMPNDTSTLVHRYRYALACLVAWTSPAYL